MDIEPFALLAELAIALAGFAGVAVAFGGRERTFTEIERIRLIALFSLAGSVLVGCLTIVCLASGGVSASVAFRIVSAAGVAYMSYVLVRTTRFILASARDPETSTETVYAVSVVGLHLVLALFYLGGVLFAPAAWILLCAFSIQLVEGLWMFLRLLMRRN